MSSPRTSALPAHTGTALALLVLCTTLGLPVRAGEVEVKFVDPDQYTDAGRSSRDREHTMRTLAEHLRALGRGLPADQTLRVEIKDIDLAGSIEPFGWHRFDEVRVLRGSADWPRVSLSYTLLADGRTLKAGDAQLADLSYMYSLRSRDRGVGEMSFERRMLQRWFDETFVTAR